MSSADKDALTAVCMSLPPAKPPTTAVLPIEAASSPVPSIQEPPVGSASWAHVRKPRRGHSEPGVASGWVDKESRDTSPLRTEGLTSPEVRSGHKAGTLQPATLEAVALYPATTHSKTLKRAILRLRGPSSGALAGAQAEPDLAHADVHLRSDHDGSGATLLLKSEVRPRLCVGFRGWDQAESSASPLHGCMQITSLPRAGLTAVDCANQMS